MVTRWGMSSRIGTVFFGHDREVFLGREMSLGQQREYSEETASAIDEEVHRIIAERYRYVEMVLSRYRLQLDEIAKRLLEKEVLEEVELRAIIANVPAGEVARLMESVNQSSPDGRFTGFDTPYGSANVTSNGAPNGGSASTPSGEDGQRPWAVQPS
jgi:cell division protease FtsH